MSGALFSRIKNWGSTDTLLASDLNAEFDNILTNFKPQMMDAYSANVVQMQVQTAPGGVGTESLATSLSGEVERLRFQLAAITGNTYWYSAPAVTLAQLNTALGANTQANSITSGRMLATSSQPAFLVPSGSTNSLTVKATSVPLVYKVAGTTVTVAADFTLTSLTTAPSTNNTVTINDPTLAAAGWTKLLGENGSTITVSGMGSSVSSLIGQIAAFKTAGSEYVICRVESTTQLTQVSRGYFLSSADALFSRTTVTNGDVWSVMKLTWVFGTSAGGGLVVYTNPKAGGTAPTSPATGDYWFDTVNNIWKTYNSTTWVASNATLLGVCIQDTTKTIGARSFDFFKAYSDNNTCELFVESTTEVRSRYTSPQVSVYGTALQFPSDFLRWNTSVAMDSGVTFSASTFYYMYLKETGDTVISDVAPFDRRADLKGYYHPLNTWRCLGYAFSNASVNFNVTAPTTEVESFFRTDQSSPISSITGAVANYPLPYNLQFTQKIMECDATSGAFTQILPPPAMWRGLSLTYVKTDSTTNAVTLQAFGNSILTTTATLTVGSTTISVLASTTGLSSGATYLISGQGIPPGTTAVWTSGATATLSQSAMWSSASVSVIWALCPGSGVNSGIQGNFSVSANSQGEMWTFMSDGVKVLVTNHYVPATTVYSGVTLISMTGTALTKGTTIIDRMTAKRQGDRIRIDATYAQTSGGTAGTGLVLLTIPNSLTADVSKAQLGPTAPTGSTLDTGKGFCQVGMGSAYLGTSGQAGTQWQSVTTYHLFSSTQIFGFCPNAGAGVGYAFGTTGGTGPFIITGASTTINWNLEIPILGWWG